jgi:AcrR family transcriptional regulator
VQAKVRKRIGKLRREWSQLGGVERGDRLSSLVNDGCSTRGLAKELGVSATTIRRHIELAKLPKLQRESVENRGSAKKQLAEAMHLRRQKRLAERMAIEERTGQFSDELADVVIAFCKGEVGSPVSKTRDDLPEFLKLVARYLQQRESSSAPRLRFSNRLVLSDRFRAAWPKKPQSDLGFDQHAEWVATYIHATEPVRPIWERALFKVSGRERELIRRAPMADSIKTFGTTTWLDIPGRPPTRPAREVLVRQGRKPTS